LKNFNEDLMNVEGNVENCQNEVHEGEGLEDFLMKDGKTTIFLS